MIQYFIGILFVVAVYGIVIKITGSGRCFRYEYIIKSIILFLLMIFCVIIIFFTVTVLFVPIFAIICFISIYVLLFLYLKYTIQRFYDLDLSGWYILLTLIPIFSIFVTIYLYFKKGVNGINNYDKAINYRQIFKNLHFINIYDNMFFVNSEMYKYERYLDNYIIEISNYGKETDFTKYLQDNYQTKEKQISSRMDKVRKTIEVSKNEFQDIINVFGLFIIYDSFYINVKGFKIFIRKENFKYAIILNKEFNEVKKELFDTFDFPGLFYEDDKFIYYNRICKKELLLWAKNVSYLNVMRNWAKHEIKLVKGPY